MPGRGVAPAVKAPLARSGHGKFVNSGLGGQRSTDTEVTARCRVRPEAAAKCSTTGQVRRRRLRYPPRLVRQRVAAPAAPTFQPFGPVVPLSSCRRPALVAFLGVLSKPLPSAALTFRPYRISTAVGEPACGARLTALSCLKVHARMPQVQAWSV